MKKAELTEGARIYYGGDMANDSGFGTIAIEINSIPNYIKIIMDDGRVFNRVPVCGFSPEYKGHGGTRFVTLAAYNTYRNTMMEAQGFSYTPIK